MKNCNNQVKVRVHIKELGTTRFKGLTHYKKEIKPIGRHRATYSVCRIFFYNLLHKQNDLKRGFRDNQKIPLYSHKNITERGFIRTL